MELHALELRYLRYFVIVAEELNYRRAAERLHISTPTLSVQIKKLEEILGVQLCERDTSKVRLTKAGEFFQHQTREVLQQIQYTIDITKEAAKGFCGHLNLGIPGRFSYGFFSSTLEAYKKQYPEVDITLTDIHIEEKQQQAVEKGTIDLGFSYSFQLSPLKKVNRLLVLDMPVRALMGKQHPLAAYKEIPLKELIKHPIYTVQSNGTQAQRIAVFLHKKRLQAEIKNASTFDTFLTQLIAGSGVSLVPAFRILAMNTDLVMRPIKAFAADPMMRVQVYALWKKTNPSPHVLNFVEMLRQTGVQNE